MLTDAPASLATTKLDKTEAAATYVTPDQIAPAGEASITSEPSVIAAVASALIEEVAGRDLIERTDAGAPNVINVVNVLVSITDAAGRQKFLTAVDTDGGPSEHPTRGPRNRLLCQLARRHRSVHHPGPGRSGG